ncbi:hypothetical protein LOTGIDRAFT_239532 [Lottia gigantea]|uniref:CCR4-NOT transcription complex subunit 1 n=1 Tax=Lottia gigantea TaxID=225164 RepID=V3ZRP3_LOTGI|nr:hypothetical protein LOTGIDRAFT_239532 [Lottia gigantea]ESO94093.1 hypothetical protein LOTGIDRAFT_239532 [Lottia gigantea]
MNLDSLSCALAEISYSVANLTKKNFKAVVTEINHLVSQHGAEADRHLFRCLFSHIEFGGDGKGSKDFHQTQFLIQECVNLLCKPDFVSILCNAIDNPFQHQKSLKPNSQLFSNISKVLKLSRVQEVAFGLALLNSTNPGISTQAAQFVKQKVPDLLHSYVDADSSGRQEGGLQDTAVETLHFLLTHLLHGKGQFGVGVEQKEALLKALRRDFPRDRVPAILNLILYPEIEDIPTNKLFDTTILPSSIMVASLEYLIQESGVGCTATVEECRSKLMQYGVKKITPGSVARVLGMMAQYPNGVNERGEVPPQTVTGWNDTPGETIWNEEIFVMVVKDLAPHLNWKDVVANLDYPEFMVSNSKGLRLLVQALFRGLQAIFPVEYIYKSWNNVGGQLSFINQALRSPDIFSFADYPGDTVVIDILKTTPNEDDRDVKTWKSLDLVETLLRLSEVGHYQQIHDLMKVPIQKCPDILVLALLQTKPSWNILKQELIAKLMPIFLGSHTNSAVVLHYAWHHQGHSNNIRTLIMHSMAEWYMRGDQHDQMRLSRILDVAQDLKALSMLLNATPFAFVIDLACLASRRGYLKLDKWLSDKISEHKEPFVQACVSFLKRRYPQLVGGPIKEDLAQMKSQQLLPETVATMLTHLKTWSVHVSQELADAITTMYNNASSLFKARQGQQPPGPNTTQFPSTNPLDVLSGIGGILAHNPTSSQTSAASAFPQLPGMNTAAPGSPSKTFPGVTSTNPTAVNPIQSLPSQFQTLNTGGGPPGDMSGIFPEMNLNQQFSKDVEDKANTYFQQIYNMPPHLTMTIDDVLEMLKRFKDSQNKMERDVFACMLRNLFEEYRFFPQYPERELHITALLFGGIIEQGIVTYWTLGIALRYILEALRKPHGSKMYYFGIAALDKFKSRLKDYPQYCQHLACIPHFSRSPQHLIEYVEYGARSKEPPHMPQAPCSLSQSMAGLTIPAPKLTPAVSAPTPSTPTSSGEISKAATFQKPSIATATNIDTLLAGQQKDEVAVPPEALQDKVFFIFNNLSQSNMGQKGEELKEQIGTEYIPWCSQYLVMKRASIEPNFHTLYSGFVDVLNIPELTDLITRETFRNIKVLLRSDKGVANFSDRTLLKNLGHWLGMLTLAKNKPILQTEIDLKSLIYEAYQKGAQELLYVVPFSAKVLESCARSKVFKAPNPWTLGIMNVLAELHMEPDLKLNLKFEIEVLCKTLSIDINDLKPTNYLKDPMRIATIEPQLSAPRIQDPVTTPTPQPFGATTPSLPPQPQYSFSEINTHSLSGLAQHIIINDQIALFYTNPNLKQYVRPALEKAVQELLPPVVERSIKVALTTCEQTVKKDFALDPDEGRMRSAAHSMVRNITAGLALITCREPLFISISNNLKTAFLSTLRDVAINVIEDAVQTLAQDNTELACAFIQKTAVDRAIPEMDKRLATEYDLRKHARSEGRRYCDPVVLTYQAERMPEQIRLRVGGVTPQQIAVYEEFARNIPGFLPLTENTNLPPGITKPVPSFAQDDVMMIYEKIIREIETHLQCMMNMSTANPMMAQLNSLMDSIMLARQNREVISAAALVKKAVEGLLDQYTMSSATDQELFFRYRECHLLVLRGLQDPRAYGPQWAIKEVTNCLLHCRPEHRYNIDAVDLLIRSQLVNLQEYDNSLAVLLTGVSNTPVQFAMQIIQRYVLDEKSPVPDAEFPNTIAALSHKVSRSARPQEGLTNLLEMIRQKSQQNTDNLGLDRNSTSAYSSMLQSGINQAKEFDDPPGLHEKTENLLIEWVNMYHSPQAGRDRTKAFFSFVQYMHQQGILKTDDLISRFFRLCTEMCVDLCYRALVEQNQSPTLIRAKCFHTLDAFVRLIALLVKHSGDSGNTVTKINLLNKILGIITGVLMQDHEVRGTEFQQLPYHRLFIMLFIELNAPEPILESINMQVLIAFCSVFMFLRPAKAPGFAYAWLELLSHRVFIGRLLALTPQQRGWGMYAQLLINLFRFLSPFLRNAELQKPTHLLYKGTLRVLLVLLHDFPEFLCDYYYAFCDVVPPNCIQMRNLILSAFPRKMRLPDPFTANLKVDSLPDITVEPRILPNYVQMIQPASFKKDLDSYLQTRAPITFLSELRSSLQQNPEPNSHLHYNIPLINALVLYVGTQAISSIQAKGQVTSMGTIAPSSHVDIFQYLAVNLDTEGRYLVLTAIANQLRYPNSHTHYFSCCMLYLFAQANNEQIQEQITRVLLERVIVNRPHPWGLLITFIEMIKNPTYKFWNHEFVHCAPEVEKMMEGVAQSCLHTTREPENHSEVH